MENSHLPKSFYRFKTIIYSVVIIPKYSVDIEHLITDSEMFSMFKTARSVRDRAIISMLWITGARPGEIARHKRPAPEDYDSQEDFDRQVNEWERLQFMKEKIEFHDTPEGKRKIVFKLPVLKRKKQGHFLIRFRNIAYTEQRDIYRANPDQKYLKCILDYSETRENNYPFFPVGEETIRNIVAKVSREALGFKLCPYNFRHTRLTKYAREHSIYETAYFKGSSDLRSAGPYVHVKESVVF